MKKDKHDKTEGNGQAFDGVNEVAAPPIEKNRLTRKIGIGIAAGLAVVAAGVGISLLVSGKFDFRAALHASTAKGTKAIADGAAEAIAKAPDLSTVETAAANTKAVDVDWFIRKLPENWHASQDAASYAAAVGVNLAEGETIVRPQTRLYCRAA